MTQKITEKAVLTTLKIEVISGVLEELAVPASLVTRCSAFSRSWTIAISRDENYVFVLSVGQLAYFIIPVQVVVSV